MEWLGIIFQGWLTVPLNWIRGDFVGPSIAAIIVFSGIAIIIFASVQFLRDLKLISKARSAVGNRSEIEFAKDFNKISQDLSGVKKVKHAWSEFSETLIKPRFDESGNILAPCENTARPQAYFNLGDLHMGPNFVKVWPSVFVGLGLAFTFFGLISALDEAVSVIDASAGETISIQNSIANLLRVSSAKFYASLFALLMSVAMTISFRILSWKLALGLSDLNRALAAGVRFLTPEQLSLEANNLLRNQLSQLTTFNTDLAMKIGEQVQASLNSSLEPVIQRLDGIGSEISNQNTDAIDSLVGDVADKIQGATTGSMERVAAILDDVSFKLGNLSDTLTSALSNFDSDFRKMLEGLKDSLKESTDGVASGIGNSMNTMSENIGRTANDVSSIMNGLTATLEQLKNVGTDVAAASGAQLREQVEAASRVASKQFEDAGRELASGFEQATTQLLEALTNVSVRLQELDRGLQTMPERLAEINLALGNSSNQIGDAAGEFGQASNSLRGLIEPLAEYAVETRKAVTEVAGAMQLTSGKVSEASMTIGNAVKTLHTEIGQQLNRLDGSDEQLARLLSGIEESTTRVLSQVNTFVSDVDRNFAGSIGALQESITEFEEVIESMQKVVRETKSR